MRMSNDYYSVQVRISSQAKQLAERMAHRDGMTLKAWIENAIRGRVETDQREKSQTDQVRD
jgi:predicted HicB family RNase H-like nuclease